MQELSPSETQPDQMPPAPQVRQPCVLVVDDDPTNRRVLKGMLESLGYACVVAEDGSRAVEAVARGQFDAVLMDCLMPVMDGYDATAAIRNREAACAATGGRRLPVIAVTALAIQGSRDRCLAAGMDDYLTKPVMLESLKEVVNRWIGQQQEAENAWTVTPGTPARAEDGPIDASMLDELRALGDEAGPALIAELVHDFGIEIPARFPLMQAAVAASDMPTLLHELHFVAGCAAIVGARHVEQIARSVNHKNAPSSNVEAAVLVSRLQAAFTVAHEELARLTASPAS